MEDKLLYRHLKPNDEVFYIGIGTKDRPYSNISRNNYWHNTVNKYGYKVEILKTGLSWEEACELEIFLISLYGRRDLGLGNLVNLTDGGELNTGYIPTEDTRKIWREQRKGEGNPMYGRKGINSPNYGRTGSKHPLYGKKQTFETVKIKTEKIMKTVIQMDLEDNFIKEWDCAKNAAKTLNLDSGSISSCCQGKRYKKVGDFKWKYKII